MITIRKAGRPGAMPIQGWDSSRIKRSPSAAIRIRRIWGFRSVASAQ